MSKALCTFAAVALLAASFVAARADEPAKAKPAADKSSESEIARYCAAVAPSAAEARLDYQLKTLLDLDARVRAEIADLQARELDAREWVLKRQELAKAATEDVTSIYTKMAPDAAASQLANMDDDVAASILNKLKPQAAGLILAEMDADRAAKLVELMAGAPSENKKS